ECGKNGERRRHPRATALGGMIARGALRQIEPARSMPWGPRHVRHRRTVAMGDGALSRRGRGLRRLMRYRGAPDHAPAHKRKHGKSSCRVRCPPASATARETETGNGPSRPRPEQGGNERDANRHRHGDEDEQCHRERYAERQKGKQRNEDGGDGKHDGADQPGPPPTDHSRLAVARYDDHARPPVPLSVALYTRRLRGASSGTDSMATAAPDIGKTGALAPQLCAPTLVAAREVATEAVGAAIGPAQRHRWERGPASHRPSPCWLLRRHHRA